ncbi:MAG: hypothetical protein OEM59_05445 [Rhodospirillales bacterium]|nr:hypothetical protein [Rhodospirillales bacterium]
MIRPPAILGLALLVLQGCAELPWVPGGQEATGSATPSAGGVVVESPPPPPPRKPPETAALTEETSEPDEARATPEVESLLGLDFVGVKELLGNPALEEIQAPATVWAYTGRGCVLNIFFYPHVDGGEYRALTYDVKSAEEAPETSQRCFDELWQDRKKTEVN